MESLERFINETDGPRYIGNPPLDQVTTAPAQATNPPETTRSKTEDSTISIPASDQESTSFSTAPSPSIFSATGSRSTADSSTTSLPADDPLPRLNVHLANMELGEQDHILPCLLQPLTGCSVSFPSSELENWHSHSISHYGHASPPTSAMCIFCNQNFVSNDPYECFPQRMNHIAAHFEMGWTLRRSRPDFGVIRDMWMKGCISKEDFDHAMSHTERPPLDGIRPHDYVPPKIQIKRDAEERRENTVIINPRQEARLRSDRKTSQTQSKTKRMEVVITRHIK